MIKINHHKQAVEINNAIKSTVDVWGRDIHGESNQIKIPRENLKDFIDELIRIDKVGCEPFYNTTNN